MNRVTILVLFLPYLHCTFALDSRHILFVILSETGGAPPPRASVTWATLRNHTENIAVVSDPYHDTIATDLKRDIEIQVFEEEGRLPIVHITHEDFSDLGQWMGRPVLKSIIDRHSDSKIKWVLFIQTRTVVRYLNLVQTLQALDLEETDVLWTGNDITIGFVAMAPAPRFSLGYALKMEVIKEFDIEYDRKMELEYDMEEFVRDSQVPVSNLMLSSLGVQFVRDRRFCFEFKKKCATYTRKFTKCGKEVPEDSIYFAVKTWGGYHMERAQVIKETWGRATSNLVFYSDVSDSSLPTVKINVTNEVHGHCDKTMMILKHAVKAVKNRSHIKWIVLSDDDTVFGIQRLCEVLSCYRGGYDSFTFLGERFSLGYKPVTVPEIFKTERAWLDFLTGGSGIVMSVGAARELSLCNCFGFVPDDIHLSWCAQHRGIYAMHSPLFHQYLPPSYPDEYLDFYYPVSFHLAWPLNEKVYYSAEGQEIYSQWFEEQDRPLTILKLESQNSDYSENITLTLNVKSVILSTQSEFKE